MISRRTQQSSVDTTAIGSTYTPPTQSPYPPPPPVRGSPLLSSRGPLNGGRKPGITRCPVERIMFDLTLRRWIFVRAVADDCWIKDGQLSVGWLHPPSCKIFLNWCILSSHARAVPLTYYSALPLPSEVLYPSGFKSIDRSHDLSLPITPPNAACGLYAYLDGRQNLNPPFHLGGGRVTNPPRTT